MPEDAKIFEKYRKQAEEIKVKENQANLWKPPEPEINIPVPYISFEHLRPLPDPERFIKDFPDIIEGNTLLKG